MSAVEQIPGLRQVRAIRYVMPLREGGSLPGLCEADDDGLYVVKLHGAGQGPKALVAELIAGEIGRALGLAVPELTFVTLPGELAKGEPDPEINALLAASAGLNLGMDFLPGALPFDPAAGDRIDPALAADIVWFDAYVANVDRTARNTNMLWWGGQLWLIDHGAALYHHHRWTDPAEQGRRPFPQIAEHVLLPQAGSLIEADRRMVDRLDGEVLWSIIATVPDVWLPLDPEVGDAGAQRRAYHAYLMARLRAPRPFIEEAERARVARDVGVIDPERRTRGRRRE